MVTEIFKRIGTTRMLQMGLFALLLICTAQATFWMFEQTSFTNSVRDSRLTDWEREARGAAAMLENGMSTQQVSELFPVVLVQADGTVQVAPDRVAALADARSRRLNRYFWEGTFFLIVLVFGMGVISQALRQRGELARRQQNFLAAVSHEFKSPLASLKLSAETLLLRRPEGEAMQKVVDRMLLDVERLSYMVANILEAARIDEGRVQLTRERVALAEETRPLVHEVGCRAHLRGVELEAELPGDACAWADPAAVRTVIANLVNNAVKSTAAKGGGKVRLTAEREGKRVRVDVRDEGVGFDPRERRRLFDKFYRPGDELRRRTQGSGLGLYIVKQFVEQGGGRVQAASEGPGRGAVFSVWWPAAPAEDVA